LSLVNAKAQDSSFYFATSDSVQLFVKVAGEGKPCLFVHGGPGSTSYYFEVMQAAPLIQQKMQMIYFDQRGSGRSASAKNGDYSLTRMEKDIDELRSYLGINKWAVMGHSFAGILVTNYAYHYPQNVSALMLIECTLNMPYSMNSHLEFGLKELNTKDQSAYRDTTKPLIERVGMVHQQLTEKGVLYKLMFRNAFEKKYSDSVTLSVKKFNWDFANAVWNIKDYEKDYTSLTKNIRCPVLVMTGDKDFAIGVDHYKSFQFPDQTVVHYIGGHAPFQEEPQWFTEKVIGFITSVH
jgi:proline iminopeptidase